MHINSSFVNCLLCSVGVIVDHEYLGDKYEQTIDKLKGIIERVIREDLRGAGLNVKYYSWSKINFNKGEAILFYIIVFSQIKNQIKISFCFYKLDLTAIFSIASCASTWETFEHVQRERLLLLAITEPDCPRLPLHEALTVISF